jgi:hypothetical protein
VVVFLSVKGSEPVVTIHSGLDATNQTSDQQVLKMNVNLASTSSRFVVVQLPPEGDVSDE